MTSPGLLKNTAGQSFNLSFISDADGRAPVVAGTPTGTYMVGTTETALGGTFTAGATQWHYALSQAETNGDIIGYQFQLAGALTERFTVATRRLDAIHFNSASGNDGNAGDIGSPVLTEAVAYQRMADMGIQSLVVQEGTFTVPVAESLNNMHVEGLDITAKLSLNSRPANGARIVGLTVDGIQGAGGAMMLERCVVDSVQTFVGEMYDCAIDGTIAIGAGTAFFDRCRGLYANAPPLLDFQNNAVALGGITHFAGPLRVDGIGVNVFVTQIHLQGVLTFESGCTLNAVPIIVSGLGDIVDNSGPSFTFTPQGFVFAPSSTVPASPGAGSYDAAYRAQLNGTLTVATVTDGAKDATVAKEATVTGEHGTTRSHVTTEHGTTRSQGDANWATATGFQPAGPVSLVAGAITNTTYAADAIQAAAIQNGALNGKGDWNVGKTGYSLGGTQSYNNDSQTDPLPANALQINNSPRAAQALEKSANTITITITCAAGSDENTIVYSAIDPAAGVDKLKGQVVSFELTTVTAALRTAKARITGGNGTNTLTLDNSLGNALPVAPAVGDVCVAG